MGNEKLPVNGALRCPRFDCIESCRGFRLCFDEDEFDRATSTLPSEADLSLPDFKDGDDARLRSFSVHGRWSVS